MKITLRQAHKLIDKINSRLATFQISATQQVNIWEVESPAETFANLQGQFQALCARNVALVTARQTIRNQIAVANRNGIDDTVAARKAALDTAGFLRHQLNTVNEHAVNTPVALARKLEAERESAKGSSAANYRGNSDTIVVCLYSQADVDAINDKINQTQLAIEKLEDQLSKLNSSTEIDLAVDIEQTLRQEGLL